VNGLACGAAQAQSRDIDPALQLAPFVVLLDHLVKETSGSCIRVCPCWSFHLGDTGKWKNLRKFQVNGLIPLACVTVLQYISSLYRQAMMRNDILGNGRATNDLV
jgi:hypothetical protein